MFFFLFFFINWVLVCGPGWSETLYDLPASSSQSAGTNGVYNHSWFNPCCLRPKEPYLKERRHEKCPAYDLCDNWYGGDYNPNVSYILRTSLHNRHWHIIFSPSWKFPA